MSSFPLQQKCPIGKILKRDLWRNLTETRSARIHQFENRLRVGHVGRQTAVGGGVLVDDAAAEETFDEDPNDGTCRGAKVFAICEEV